MGNETPPPGIRPLMHEPNRLWPWVFRQHQVWVDINGSEHEIESMPLEYVENVIGFCVRRALWIYALGEYEDGDQRTPGLEWGVEGDDRVLMIRAADWLEQTPLIRALRRRLDRHTAS